MTECPHFDHLLVIPRLRVQNANAISSPLTHGFPSMTAFLGLMWALERKTRAAGLDVQFNAVAAVCHSHQEQVTEGSFVRAFRLSRNPILRRIQKKLIDKDGKAEVPAIVEEGRIHLEISLVFGVQSRVLDAAGEAESDFPLKVRDLLMQMRVAGGSLIPSNVSQRRQSPYVVAMPGDEQERAKVFDRIKLRLLPGFALVGRDDLLDQRHALLRDGDPQATRLDAWLSLARINWRCQPLPAKEGQPEKVKWEHDRKQLGWVVPIPVGYGALTDIQPAGSVVNARDVQIPFRFVESLYSVGQWISPHRLETPEQLLWYADSQPQAGLYRCRNDYRPMPV